MESITEHDVAKYLYKVKGYSSRQVGEILSVDGSTVRNYMRGDLRKRLGYDVEESVANLMKLKGCNVVRMPECHPFDLLIDGKKVDVKSATRTYDKTNKNYKFAFQLQDVTSRASIKNLHSSSDYLYLVFMYPDQYEVYAVETATLTVKCTLSIKDPRKTKNTLNYIGSIKRGGKNELRRS